MVVLQLPDRVVEDLVDGFCLGVGVRELAGRLPDELFGHLGVDAGPVGFVGALVQVVLGVLLHLRETADERRPVRQSIVDQLEVGIAQRFEFHRAIRSS